MSDNHKNKSRRRFIKTAIAGAAGASLSFQPAEKQTEAAADLEYDVVIVGGGVAGCYTAYRLMTATLKDFKTNSPLRQKFISNGNKLKVGLFEYSGRVGGRLVSGPVPGVPGYYAEFGGFRFQHSMNLVWDTAQHLGLTDEAFPVDQPENILYLRGKRLTRKEVNDGKNLPYNLVGKEKGMTPDDLNNLVANTAIPNFTQLQAKFQDAYKQSNWKQVAEISQQYEELKKTSVVAGRPISDWSFWSLMRHVLSQEAVDLLEDSGGYNTLFSAGNVTNNLDETFYFSDDPYRHIKEGYSAIPGKLEEAFANKGGETHIGRQLLSFNKAQGGGYDMVFYKREPGPGIAKNTLEAQLACDQSAENCLSVKAGFVVLALPKRSLNLLDQDNFFFQNKQVQQLLDTVISVDAFRFFLAYDNPWWKAAYGGKIPEGRGTTDLGIRQYYYWYAEGQNATLLRGTNTNALVLVSYSNGQAERYWRPLQKGQPFDDLAGVTSPSTIYAPRLGGPRPASVTMALEAHRQFVEVHGLDINKVPEPYYAHFENWTKDPWGGGWHAWATGVNQDEVIPKIRQPLPGEQVYVVGESYSNIQGWVWGALNSAESTLQCNLGLTWPDFVTKQGTWLGPGTKWLMGNETDPCL